MKAQIQTIRQSKLGKKTKTFFKQYQLQTMILPGLLVMLIFHYRPIYGVIMAFRHYTIISPSIMSAPWAGLHYFREFLTDPGFYEALRNTLGINIYGLLISFPTTIIFALFLNEIQNAKFKRFTQTVSYLPHFISWVIFAGIIRMFLSTDAGVFNEILVSIGLIDKPIFFLGNPDYFWGLAVITSLIKGLGWGAILYLAAIAGVDQELYEAAFIDGAGRFRRMWHVTIPGIRGTMVILLILTISNILNWGFDQIWMLQNNLNIATSETLETYTYKLGIQHLRFSYATAVGLTKSVIGTILLIVANFFSKKLTDRGLF